MKKNLFTASIIILLILLSGCGKGTEPENGDQITPTQTPAEALPDQETQEDTEASATVKDYYPFQADHELVYEGQGNEYASYRRYIDFIDKENNRIQTRTNNGGTETVEVIEIKNGTLSVIKSINECYYREDFLDGVTSDDDAEILLMEPLKQGTEWLLSDGRKRYISDMATQIETPAGSYKAIEVTTKGSEDTTKDYYALGIGLVKSVYLAKDMEVTSSLSEINTNTPFTQQIEVYYPDADEKIYVEPVSITFQTDDITERIMEETLKKHADKDTYLPLASDNTVINSLYLGENNIVYVDFSGEFVRDMNVGSGYELLILQSVTNTLGGYYQSNEVTITLDGKPYESGHILMKEGETFKVSMEKVVR